MKIRNLKTLDKNKDIDILPIKKEINDIINFVVKITLDVIMLDQSWKNAAMWEQL